MDVPKKLERVNRSYQMSSGILEGKNLRRILLPAPIYKTLKGLTLRQLFLLSYIGFAQFKDELNSPTCQKDLDFLQSVGLVNQAKNKLTASGVRLVGAGVYPVILKANEYNKFNRKAIYQKNFIKYKYSGKIITSNDWSMFDFQDVPYEEGYGIQKKVLQPRNIVQMQKGGIGYTIKDNFYNNVILTPLSIEVGKSIIFHTIFRDDKTNRFTPMQYRIPIRDYCYFINEYGSHDLKFLAKRDDHRPEGILVMKGEQKIGLLLLKDGNYYNKFDYGNIYLNYQEYVEIVKGLNL